VYFRAVRDFFRITLCAALLLPTVACTGPTGLPGGKQLNELDADDRQKACENIQEYYDKEVDDDTAKRYACIFATILATDVDSCEVAYEACLMEPLMENTDDDSCAVTDETTCTATVEEYEACLDEQIAAFKDVSASFSCEASINGSFMIQTEPGPDCKALADTCPGFFGGGGEGT
jgi:hypothetical protein